MFNLISVISGLYWTSVSYLLPTVFEDLDLFGGLMWSLTDTIEIVQICHACNRIVTSVSVKQTLIHFQCIVQGQHYFSHSFDHQNFHKLELMISGKRSNISIQTN